MIKTSIANLYEGTCQRVILEDLRAFGAYLDGLQPNEAVIYGVPKGLDAARIVTEAECAHQPDAISRTRRCFEFAASPGILMLDHDPSGDRHLAPEELIGIIRGLAPCLGDVAMLWRASVSSGISSEDGTIDTGIAGQRLYLPVTDASLISAAGKALVDLLWAHKQGSIKIGTAGQALERTLVDASVWQPERLDFAASPVLAPGLSQQPRAAFISGDPGLWLEARDLIAAADGKVQALAASARKTARAVVKPLLTEARAAWAKETAPEIAARHQQPVAAVETALLRACTHHELTGDFVLQAGDGSTPTVGELLDNPARWHNQRFADPLEPDYRDDPRIAWANLRSGGRPYLHSHAHGGRRFYLLRPSARIQLRIGDRARVVDDVLAVLGVPGDLFENGGGGGLVRVTEDARVVPVTPDWLADRLDRQIAFYVQRPSGGDEGSSESPTPAAKDAPVWLAQRIMAKDGERRLPRLDAVITAPTLRRDGSVLAEPGYDPTSRLLFVNQAGAELPPIPEHPSQEQAREALECLWGPFALFPLVDAVDRGVVLNALLTAVERPSLPTAHGIGLDAPAAGTGKTLLAKAIGALCLGQAPAILPPAGHQDEETRKRLFAVIREGQRVILWDNVREPLGNTALDAFLTAPTYTDRILGSSATATLPNRALFLATGNNLRLVGDTCRRILVARLDAGIEKPYSREFAFSPLAMVLERRLDYVVAALTLMRAWIAAGRPRHGQGRAGSFEEWDDLVRQTVCWIATWDERFDDPLRATERAYEQDPDSAKLGTLLEALDGVVGEDPFTTPSLINQVAFLSGGICPPVPSPLQALHDALMDIAGVRDSINPRILGVWLAKHVDRRQGGRRLQRGKMSRGRPTWRLVREPVLVGLVGSGGSDAAN